MNHPVTLIPPLENGDKLNRAEFERRYEAMPRLKKAELIEGIVHMPPPTHAESHGKPHGHIITWLGYYEAITQHVELYDNTTVRLNTNNEVQPDALLRLLENAGGQSRITEDDYIEGAPELIVEIAASTATYDFHVKKAIYQQAGVKEYLIWRVYDQQFDWFVLQNEEYITEQPNEQGLIYSRIFSGLVLAVNALLAGDLATVLNTLRSETTP